MESEECWEQYGNEHWKYFYKNLKVGQTLNKFQQSSLSHAALDWIQQFLLDSFVDIKTSSRLYMLGDKFIDLDERNVKWIVVVMFYL